ncbi:multiple sugar transport system substrate-binding protein [Mycolicibacterium sp. BK556]|uniref:ABC transporter substrate-binding protein n=1 Tax=unclassified Mycolicibacterium TaxID=2636767 RepID=UPI00161B15E1|nr:MULTISPECIES: sugar ABC transporter substrate-binding protein [unclassified Mycolicibacterium]MBB3603274.1 multiple sugar transport system substrate-binding protein [Mycolicibacterium sp. BK556]MBB3633469.1 multiple sugar transport system substrate-binding protein [Mycolicibacterium sp. BK607]
MRFSTRMLAGLITVALLLVAGALVLGRSGDPSGKTVVTVRLWDRAVAAAYAESFAEFMRAHPDIEVRTDVVAYASYFDTLRTDVAGGGADDIFWINNANFAEYADNNRLMAVEPSADWDRSVVAQFTRDGTLWGVPQLTDAGIALYYNADLLAAERVGPAELDTLRWDPDPGVDTLRPLLKRLTHGRQWGYNAANDLQAIYLNYIGSAGGVFNDGDRFAFVNPQAVTAFEYVIGLINSDQVSPPASDTNDNGDFSRNQFLSGRMALFQSGTYNLAQVAEHATFRWGVAMLPTGPAGRVSVTNGIVAAGNPASRHPEAVREVLDWLGSTRGNEYVGRAGAAIPAVLPAQQVYFDYWSAKGVDVRPFFTVLDGPRIPAPGGAGFAAGYQAIKPYFAEMFLGRTPVTDALRAAQIAANAAASR